MKLALTFSGGGYRAAGFSLGTLSYLYMVPFGSKGQTLGDQVMVLSTVSGGTITGTRYALGLLQEKDIKLIFKAIYDFLADTELVKEALGNLANDDKWKNVRIRSLISSFADVYDRALFDHKLFGDLMVDDDKRQLKHVSFNATEFAHGAQFRFQWTEKMLLPENGEKPRGIIGNHYYDLPEDIAKKLRLGDILASSSCFPAGFEPINLPGDLLPGEQDASWMKDMDLPVGLMDGGVVDNQGIVPVLLAETRMERNLIAAAKLAEDPKPVFTSPEIDLIMVTDVASPYMEAYQQSQENRTSWWSNIRLRTLVATNTLLMMISIGMAIWSYHTICKGWLIGSTIAATLFTTLFLVLWLIGSLPKLFGVPKDFLEPLGALLKLPLYVYHGLIFNRVNSFKMLAMNVFLKHERAMNYNTIYQDERWKNRRIMCAAYELRTDEINKRQAGKKAVPEDLIPSKELMSLADNASRFGTTLWFTEEDVRMHMLNMLIACGQTTACWNLLEYIGKVKADKKNLNAEHQLLIGQETTIRQHWDKLQIDPFALLSEYGVIDDWKEVSKELIKENKVPKEKTVPVQKS